MKYRLPKHMDKGKIFIVDRSLVQERMDALYHRENFNFTGYVRLSEYVLIKGGKRIPKGTHYSSDLDSPYLYLRVIDLSDENNVDYSSLKRIDKSLYECLGRYEVNNGDVIMSIAGSIGKVLYLHDKPTYKKVILTENCAKIIVKDCGLVLPEYLSILLKSSIVQKQISLNYIQTTIPKLSLERIGRLLIPPIPSLKYQSGVIDKYNKAIEEKRQKYNKAILILENIERYLSTELLLTVPRVDDVLNNRIFYSSLKKIEGNRIDPLYSMYLGRNTSSEKFDNISLRTIAHIMKGDALTGDESKTGSIPVIAGGQVSPYCHDKSNFDGNVITVSASGAYAGYVWYHATPIYATDCCVIFSKDETCFLTKYLFEVLKFQQKFIYRLQTGTAQPHVYASDLQMLNIPVISLEKQKEIIGHIDDMRRQANNLLEEGETILKNVRYEIDEMIIGSY